MKQSRIYIFFYELYSGKQKIAVTFWVGFSIYMFLHILIPHLEYIALANIKLFCIVYGLVYFVWVLNGCFIFNALITIYLTETKKSTGALIACTFSFMYALVPIFKLLGLIPDN